jgi:hypothetical protein
LPFSPIDGKGPCLLSSSLGGTAFLCLGAKSNGQKITTVLGNNSAIDDALFPTLSSSIVANIHTIGDRRMTEYQGKSHASRYYKEHGLRIVSAELPVAHATKLKAIAEKQGMSVSRLIRTILMTTIIVNEA